MEKEKELLYQLEEYFQDEKRLHQLSDKYNVNFRKTTS